MSLPVVRASVDTADVERAFAGYARDLDAQLSESLWPVAEDLEGAVNRHYTGRAASFKARRPLAPGAPIVVGAPWWPVGFLDQGTLGGKVGGTKQKRIAKKRGNYQGAGIRAREGLAKEARAVQDDVARAALDAVHDNARRHGLEVVG